MEKLPFDDYQISAWIGTLGSAPVERLRHETRDESYEMHEAHLVRLENGKFATIMEDGCSCYDPLEAKIEIHPTGRSASAAIDKWVRDSEY